MKKLLIITAFIIFLPFNISLAFFSDTEVGDGTFSTATLSFDIIPDAHSSGISDAFSPLFGFSVLNTGTHQPQYKITASTTANGCDVTDFYNELNVIITGPNSLSYTGSLNDLSLLGDFTGSWSMQVETSNNFSAYIGETCEFVLTIGAWQQGMAYADGGFTDTNTATFALTSVGTVGQQDTANIVLNEIYPNEISTTTVLLDQEWVELYNGTDSPIDIEGWKLGELAGGAGTETRHVISSANTCVSGSKVGYARPYNGASTIIPANGLLIVEFCASGRMFNNGDTIALYDAGSIGIDTHTYPDTPDGKSHARIPDGGTWVDPIPSPGISNMETITAADLLAEGWNITAIESVLGSDEDDLSENNTQSTLSDEQHEENTDLSSDSSDTEDPIGTDSLSNPVLNSEITELESEIEDQDDNGTEEAVLGTNQNDLSGDIKQNNQSDEHPEEALTESTDVIVTETPVEIEALPDSDLDSETIEPEDQPESENESESEYLVEESNNEITEKLPETETEDTSPGTLPELENSESEEVIEPELITESIV